MTGKGVDGSSQTEQNMAIALKSSDEGSVEKLNESLANLSEKLNKLEVKGEKVNNKSDIIAFSPETGMEFTSWLKYFDAVCVNEGKDDIWKIRHIQKFLKDSALTLFINNCLHILHWSELVELFSEHYSSPENISLNDFTSIRFKNGDDLNEYYQKKVKVARNLGLDPKFILEGLSEGLPLELRKLILVNNPKNTTEWRELVFRLNKLQNPEKHVETKKEEPFYRPPVQNQQWRQKPYFGSVNNMPMRQWGYRVPHQPPQNRPPNQMRNPPTFVRPTYTNTPRFSSHHSDTTSPAPCRVCASIGIPQAYHWVQNCPFKNQILTSPKLTTQPNMNVGTQDQTGNNTAWDTQGNKF